MEKYEPIVKFWVRVYVQIRSTSISARYPIFLNRSLFLQCFVINLSYTSTIPSLVLFTQTISICYVLVTLTSIIHPYNSFLSSSGHQTPINLRIIWTYAPNWATAIYKCIFSNINLIDSNSWMWCFFQQTWILNLYSAEWTFT